MVPIPKEDVDKAFDAATCKEIDGDEIWTLWDEMNQNRIFPIPKKYKHNLTG
jgi:hypothetical protein